jgi:hypothetical protein
MTASTSFRAPRCSPRRRHSCRAWSTRAPWLIGIVREGARDVVRAGAESALAASGVPGRVLALQADRRGIVYDDEAEVTL